MLTLIHYSCWMHFKYQVCQYLTSNHKSRVQLPTLVLLRTFVDKMAFLNGKNKQNMWNSEQDIQPSVHIWRSIKVQEQAVQVFKFNKILLTSEHPTRALNFRCMLTIDTHPARQWLNTALSQGTEVLCPLGGPLAKMSLLSEYSIGWVTKPHKSCPANPLSRTFPREWPNQTANQLFTSSHC